LRREPELTRAAGAAIGTPALPPAREFDVADDSAAVMALRRQMTDVARTAVLADPDDGLWM
jgi:hypothetical protein